MNVRLEKCDEIRSISRDAFSDCHPLVNLIYFVFIIGFTIASLNPICLAITFISSLAYSVVLGGREKIAKKLRYMIPLLLLTAVINPLFSHQGVTFLTYLPSGNPLTLESILYGIAAAFAFVSVLSWFSCFNEVMTSDKMIYLFGRVAPQLSLVISMTLKFIPEFTERIKQVYKAEKAAGFPAEGKYFEKIRMGIRAVSSAATWALERAIITGDSMKSRGYGLKGRTSYSLFTLHARDIAFLLIILTLGITLFLGMLNGAFKWEYYPYIYGKNLIENDVVLYVIYGVMAFFPTIIHEIIA